MLNKPLLDPKDYIITRKRKQYKFALFHNSSLCFEHDEWDSSYQTDVLEIGAGTGLFATALAGRDTTLTYTAMDVKGDRLQSGARAAEREHLSNVRFLRTRADLLPELFLEHSLSTIWLTFSDPFPRKHSAGRRLTHPAYLKKYRHLLHADGALCIKHDSRAFFDWSLEQLAAGGWRIVELSFDLHNSSLPEEYKIMTTYEKRWIDEGGIINFVKALPPV